ncbi:MAG: amidohydrolase family protein [Rhodospirillales bacterium]|jgi:4-oxalmesaconate hydratase|nr:amidohydrolase family protein [Rhodospirillales bacterium]MDP6642982.1 amidohydrolase family protein [Rhodospirillales bacterium]MDP6840736.1 amidohydrolase family protein [Rhodospirillales bacterium]
MIIDCHAHVVAPMDLYAYKGNLIANAGATGYNPPKIADEKIAASTENNVKIQESVGTDVQFISPRPFQMMHSQKPAKIVQYYTWATNDVIARVCETRPDRFRGVGSMPQAPGTEPKDWLAEIDRCVGELGFVGLLLNPDPSEGWNTTPALGDAYWYPVYEKMCELDIPALIHSSSCCNERESYSGHFITEESIATLSLLASRVFLDFPDLKIIVGHGGGSVPYQMGRWEAERGLPTYANNQELKETFSESLKRLYYDTCIHYKPSLELLFGLVGADRCLFGTEKPGSGSAFNEATGRDWDDIKTTIEEIDFLSQAERDAILGGNAEKLYPRFKA